jgi:hypothetical protein
VLSGSVPKPGKKPQVPPLRFAPVGMTILLQVNGFVLLGAYGVGGKVTRLRGTRVAAVDCFVYSICRGLLRGGDEGFVFDFFRPGGLAAVRDRAKNGREEYADQTP